MVIDTHVRPALYGPVCTDKERFQKRIDTMNYHLMSPAGIDLLKKQYALADIRKVFLLPSDHSAETGFVEISNEEIEEIVKLDPEFFIGFASVDPRNEDAEEKLEEAFQVKNLSGLYLNTARLQMAPTDTRIRKLLDVCKSNKKPVIFQAGFSLEHKAIAMYARPVIFEPLFEDYPDVNFSLTHVGWPWVQETAALLLKYPNVYTDTALMNFDGPYQIFHKVFKEDMGELWVEHNIADKIMFGSDTPRIRPVRSKRGLDSLEFSPRTMEKIYYKNALRFLGREE